MSKVDKKFIVQLQGKDFVTYEGLLDLAHQSKLKSIVTEIIQLPTAENNNQCIIKATATTEDDKHFEGYGDADSSNVNSMIAKHLIRMAETRAKARALRDLTNVGMTAVEELGESEELQSPEKPKKPDKKIDEDKEAIKNGSLASEAQIKYIDNLLKKKNYTDSSMKEYLKKTYNKDDIKALNKKEAGELINMLNEM